MEQQTPLEALIAKYQRSHWEYAEADFSDLNHQFSDGDTLLHRVTLRGNIDEVELLVASGARVNVPGNLGYTALHYAAMKGHAEIAKKLLSLGANPSIKNEWGQTAEVVAMEGEHADIAKLLRHNKYRNMQRNK